MATLVGQDLINSVIIRGYPDSDAGVSIQDYLNAEYRNIAGERRWEWLQATNTALVTVPGTLTYALPMSDARNLDAVFVTDSAQNQYPVSYLQPLDLLDLQQDNPTLTTGPPQRWSMWAGSLLFYPTPDAVYSVTIVYTKKVTPITAATSPLLPDEYCDGLVWGAIVPFAHRQHDFLGREFAIQMRDRVWGEMRSEYQLKQRQNADRVETTGIWNGGSAWSSYGWPMG